MGATSMTCLYRKVVQHALPRSRVTIGWATASSVLAKLEVSKRPGNTARDC